VPDVARGAAGSVHEIQAALKEVHTRRVLHVSQGGV
jgi:hypothetical protein